MIATRPFEELLCPSCQKPAGVPWSVVTASGAVTVNRRCGQCGHDWSAITSVALAAEQCQGAATTILSVKLKKDRRRPAAILRARG